MLLVAIEQLINSQNLSKVHAQILIKAIYRYALKLNTAKQLKHIGSKLGVTPALMEFKRVHLNNSHYVLSRLWRAVYSYYCEKMNCDRCWHCDICAGEVNCEKFEWDFNALAEEYNVDVKDLLYIIKHDIIDLSEDRETLKARENVLNPPNPAFIDSVIMEAMPYIKYVVYKKLAFIFTYNNLEPADFINDLMAWALSHLNDNDYISDKDELMKIVITSVNQMSVNIIAQYTSQKRSRLTSTESGYKSTLISLESSEYMPLKKAASTPLDEEELLRRITSKMSEKEIYFLQQRLEEGEPKGDILAQLNWSGKEMKVFKDKVKNLLEMCTV